MALLKEIHRRVRRGHDQLSARCHPGQAPSTSYRPHAPPEGPQPVTSHSLTPPRAPPWEAERNDLSTPNVAPSGTPCLRIHIGRRQDCGGGFVLWLSQHVGIAMCITEFIFGDSTNYSLPPPLPSKHPTGVGM